MSRFLASETHANHSKQSWYYGNRVSICRRGDRNWVGSTVGTSMALVPSSKEPLLLRVSVRGPVTRVRRTDEVHLLRSGVEAELAPGGS